MSVLNSIILASLFVSSISLVGSLLLIWKKLLTTKYSFHLVGFAAGVLLTTALLDLLPEAAENKQGTDIYVPLLLGIVVFFFLERFVIWFHHHDDDHGAKPTIPLILIGDGIHNTFDGIAIAAAFLTNPAVGIAATFAIAAHEIPQEIADFMVLVHGGLGKIKALFFNILSALTALLGAVAGFYFLEKLQNLQPVFLAFTAGMFIYITCSDLIPDLHHDFKKQKGWTQSIPFILGIVVMWLIINLLAE